jgi:alpha-1,3-rhamnosyl/mannosyltransferase
MNSRPHILLSARVYDRQVGGNTRYVRSVYERIADHGVDFTLARPPRAVEAGRLRSAMYAGLESLIWPMMASGKPSVIHFPADTGAAVSGRTPIVGTIHGLATLHMDGVRGSGADRLWRARVKRLARVSDRIITVSNSSADDIAAFAPRAADRISVIHHGIDHARFNVEPVADFGEVRTRLGVPGDYFLYAGNLDPRKNVVELARAAGMVYAKTGIPLVVSGSAAWDSKDILRAVSETPGVIYVGRTSDADLVSLLQNAVAFCFPSSYEGFGFPVLEAMACGAPVICSDRGSLKEVAGQAAVTLSEIDSSSIAEAMLELLENGDRARLIAAGLQNAANFDWNRSAARHAEVFKEVSR